MKTSTGRRTSRNILSQRAGANQRSPVSNSTTARKPISIMNIVCSSVQVSAIDVFPRQTISRYSRTVRCELQSPPSVEPSSGRSTNGHGPPPIRGNALHSSYYEGGVNPRSTKKELELVEFCPAPLSQRERGERTSFLPRAHKRRRLVVQRQQRLANLHQSLAAIAIVLAFQTLERIQLLLQIGHMHDIDTQQLLHG